MYFCWHVRRIPVCFFGVTIQPKFHKSVGLLLYSPNKARSTSASLRFGTCWHLKFQVRIYYVSTKACTYIALQSGCLVVWAIQAPGGEAWIENGNTRKYPSIADPAWFGPRHPGFLWWEDIETFR